jgi:hypothetical protein
MIPADDDLVPGIFRPGFRGGSCGAFHKHRGRAHIPVAIRFDEAGRSKARQIRAERAARGSKVELDRELLARNPFGIDRREIVEHRTDCRDFSSPELHELRAWCRRLRDAVSTEA